MVSVLTSSRAVIGCSDLVLPQNRKDYCPPWRGRAGTGLPLHYNIKVEMSRLSSVPQMS